MVLPYPVKPIHPSPVVNWNNGILTATRQFVVPSENVDDFILYLLDADDGVCGLPTTFPGWDRVFVDSIEATPISPCCFVTPDGLGYLQDPATELEGYPSPGASQSDSDANNTCWWKVVVGYQTKEFIAGQDGVREGTWLTYDRNISGFMASIPSRNLYWASTGLQVRDDTRVNTFIPTGDINISWHFVTEADMCEIEPNLYAVQGCVNSTVWGDVVFPGGCFNPWPQETLLYTGYSTSAEIGTKRVFGSYCTTIETKRTLSLSFKWRQQYGLDESGRVAIYGWNHEYNDTNVGAVGWDRVVSASGKPLYDLANFSNLFI